MRDSKDGSMKITLCDIYKEQISQRKLIEENVVTVKVHEEKLNNLRKVAYGTAGSLLTIVAGVFIFILTRGKFP